MENNNNNNSDSELNNCWEATNSSMSSADSQYFNDEGREGNRKHGRCKWFNVAKGWGFITPTDGSQEVFVHQSVIQMGGFRSLKDEEEVEFEWKLSDKGVEATLVTGPEGSSCVGSEKRPRAKKKPKKIRCYNCGDLAHHIASKCNLGPQPKRCHSCKAIDHLIADCPLRAANKGKGEARLTNGSINSLSDSGTPASLEEMNSEEGDADQKT